MSSIANQNVPLFGDAGSPTTVLATPPVAFSNPSLHSPETPRIEVGAFAENGTLGASFNTIIFVPAVVFSNQTPFPMLVKHALHPSHCVFIEHGTKTALAFFNRCGFVPSHAFRSERLGSLGLGF